MQSAPHDRQFLFRKQVYWLQPPPKASNMNRPVSLNALLWTDALAALSVGLAVLAVKASLAGLFRLPESWLAFSSVVSLGYFPFSFYLARQENPARELVKLLAAANMAYALVCAIIILVFYRSATLLGLGYLILEMLFVATLAVLEWRKAEEKGLR